MTDRISIAIENHVAIVTLNRPDKHNALDLAMFEAIGRAGQEIAANPTVRAVVLEGAGASFCAGIDTSIFGGDVSIGPDSWAPGAASPANLFQRAAYTWREVPVPVICAITGVAYGGGLQIALGADLRFARPDARLSVMEIKWGLVPDMAITTTALRSVRHDWLKELALTGRVVDGEEACRLGLVTAVHDDPAAAARETAAQMAAKSPDAVRAIKNLLDEAWDLGDADRLKLEARLHLAVIGRPNQVEAVAANAEGREPQFSDPTPEDL